MNLSFLLRSLIFAATALLTIQAQAGSFYFYADTARVLLSPGQYYYPGTGTPGSVQVRNSYGQLVTGCRTDSATFYPLGSQVVGTFSIYIPSPGTYSFSFPAQNGSGVRYYSAFYTLVDQGGSLVLSGGQSNWLHGEAFIYNAPPTYGSNYVTILPSGPLSALYTSGYIRVKAPLTRAGHSFILNWQTSENGPTSSAYAYYTAFATIGSVVNGNAAGQLQSLLIATPTPSPTYTYVNGTYSYVPFSAHKWWITDTTAGQQTEKQNGTPNANSSVLDCAWTQTSSNGVPYRYVAIPESRRYDNLGLYDNGVWTSVSTGYYVLGTYYSGTSGATAPIGWFVGSATGPIESTTAYVGDLTTGERTEAGATDVRPAYCWWVDPQYTFYPVINTQVTLHSRELGHRFAVHSKKLGGPVWSRVFSAIAGSGNAKLDFPVGKGLQFWVTREAENGSVNQPVAPVNASANGSSWVATINGATFSAISPNPNLFPPAPSRPVGATISRTVRVNAGVEHAGHNFTVLLGDGYATTFGPTPQTDPVTLLPVPAYAPGVINQWNGVSVPNLPIYGFTAQTDWRFSVTLRDQATQAEITPSDIGNQIDWLAPWVSPTLGSPPGPTITLNLPQTRKLSMFARPDLADAVTGQPFETLSRTASPVVQMEDYVGPGVVGLINPYHVPIRSIEFTNPTPNVPGSFPLIDLDLDDPTPITVSAGTNDLKTWFAPPVAVAGLQISTSRWDHVLRLVHPTGESFPITREQMEGHIDADPNGTGSLHPYYLFSARSVARPDLPWYIEDLSTEPAQRIGPTGNSLRPTNFELTVWYHLPTPKGLTGVTSVGQRRVELVWSRTGASLEGGFEIERRLTDSNGSTNWTPVLNSPFAAGESFTDGSFTREVDGLYHFIDPIPDGTIGKVRSYRVRYRYGTPADYSLWSDEVSVTGWADTDNDGLPDAWEMAYFGSLSYAASGAPGDPVGDADLDGISNIDEFNGHTNPNALPANAPGSTLIVYTPFQ